MIRKSIISSAEHIYHYQHDIRTHRTPFLLLNLCLCGFQALTLTKSFLKHRVSQENAFVAQSFREPIPKRMSLGKTSTYS